MKNKPKGLKKSWKNHEKVMKAGHFPREYGLVLAAAAVATKWSATRKSSIFWQH